jgi:hypothetical protein
LIIFDIRSGYSFSVVFTNGCFGALFILGLLMSFAAIMPEATRPIDGAFATIAVVIHIGHTIIIIIYVFSFCAYR